MAKINKSRKNKGGDINKHNPYKYILSIGYEIETDFLAKLTNGYNEEGDPVLYNTDSNTRNLEYLENQEPDEDDFEDRIRREEVVQIDAYNNGVIDENIKFAVTNDMASTGLSKKLNNLCCPNLVDQNLKYQSSYCGGEIALEEKNKLYKLYTERDFETNTGEVYNIEFVYWNETECGSFSDVEWVLTYYKPQQSENIILSTFQNAVENLSRHLNELEETDGSLILNEIMIKDDNGKIVKKYPEQVIGNPAVRSFFRSPGLNLYYLQTKNQKTILNVNEICPTFQMTFAANVIHIFQILKQLSDDKIMSIECGTEESKERLNILQRIEFCVDKLVTGYNEKQRNPNLKLMKTESNKTVLKQFKSYLGLILFKMYIYYNIYFKKEMENKKENEGKPKEIQKIIYFKDSLFFNPRHSNYDFYVWMKKSLLELLSPYLNSITTDETKQNQIVANIIQSIVLQPVILNELLLDGLANADQNAFDPRNQIKKNSENYGNPYYSLGSYFQFFEKPTNNINNLYADDTFINYDWFQYRGIDKVSTQMDIKDNVVLIEVRNFQKLMANYVLGFADPKLKSEILNNKTCNKLDKMCILGINLGSLEKFFERNSLEMGGRLYRKSNIVQRKNTTKKTNIKKNNTKKTKTKINKKKSIKKNQ
jgi:hypothetical protein